mmetsp:Transcript_73281/g.184618  ORF Transcript_73281/g.184618 Transcript_73281/m.184618 type:complete len:298 (+) Transcript_73281:535-1428(+)
MPQEDFRRQHEQTVDHLPPPRHASDLNVDEAYPTFAASFLLLRINVCGFDPGVVVRGDSVKELSHIFDQEELPHCHHHEDEAASPPGKMALQGVLPRVNFLIDVLGPVGEDGLQGVPHEDPRDPLVERVRPRRRDVRAHGATRPECEVAEIHLPSISVQYVLRSRDQLQQEELASDIRQEEDIAANGQTCQIHRPIQTPRQLRHQDGGTIGRGRLQFAGAPLTYHEAAYEIRRIEFGVFLLQHRLLDDLAVGVHVERVIGMVLPCLARNDPVETCGGAHRFLPPKPSASKGARAART